VRPNKRLGQNFLIDSNVLREIVDAAELSGDEFVLEVGAGLGTLTKELAARAGNVLAIELDHRLLPALREVVQRIGSVRIAEGDVLQMELAELVGKHPYCVVANIPFNITSALIRKLVEAKNSPFRIVLTIQREVAERAVARPGQMSLLALAVQVFGRPVLVARVPAAAFYPRPKVDSAVLRIDRHEIPPIDPNLLPLVFRLARAGFSQRRKMLKNSLSTEFDTAGQEIISILERAAIGPGARPQELSLVDWANLARIFSQGRLA
jgi:16S rRNA (adenine1518-N6/adenine1519-N6)-dimethyltransferase